MLGDNLGSLLYGDVSVMPRRLNMKLALNRQILFSVSGSHDQNGRHDLLQNVLVNL